MSRRRCTIAGCKTGCQATQLLLHTLPKDSNVRYQWLKFIFSEISEHFSPTLTVCSAHFSADCFLNQAQFSAGFSSRPVIKDASVPTLLGPTNDCTGLTPKQERVSKLVICFVFQ